MRNPIRLLCSLHSRMAIAASSALRFVEHFDCGQYRLLVACDDELRDALSVVDGEGILREVDEQHHQFATVVGVDGSRRVEHRDTVLQGQSAAGPHLCLIALGQRDVEPRGDQATLQGLESEGLGNVGAQIHARTLCRSIRGQRLPPLVDDLYLDHNS